MVMFRLYMCFPSDLDNWWEVSILPIGEFSESHIGEQPNVRLSWSDLVVKNNPLNYKATPSNRYKLYDLIMAEKPTTNIKLKFVSDEYPDGIFGYFGPSNCEPDDNKKLLTIKPTILDNYTPILENEENEIKLYDESNIVKNPKFAIVSEIIPNYWIVNELGHLKLERIWLDNKTAVKISDEYYDGATLSTEVGYNFNYLGIWNPLTNTPNLELISNPNSGDYYIASESGYHTNKWGTWYYDAGFDYIIYSNVYKAWLPAAGIATYFPSDILSFSQTIPFISKGKQAKFSFAYFFSGESRRKKSGYFNISITDSITSDVYLLQQNTKFEYVWIPKASWTSPICYDKDRTCINVSSFSKYDRFSIVIPNAPVNGTIEITFTRAYDTDISQNGWDADCNLILSDVIYSIANIELKTINIKFDAGNMVSAFQESDKIVWDNKIKGGDKYFRRMRKDRDKDNNTTLFYYIDETTGEPILANLSDSELGLYGNNKVYYKDLIEIFNSGSNVLKDSYKFELSELTVYRGKAHSGNYREWFAIAKFSREEVYKTDEYELDDQGSETETLIPPASDSNWVQTETFQDYQNDPPKIRLWVRKPFSDIDLGWTRGEVDGDGTLKTYDNKFNYYYSLTTKKNYPTTGFEITSAIDLRELITKVYTETHEDLKGKKVYSSFLWNDCEPDGALPDAELQHDLGLEGQNIGTNYANFSNSSTGVQPKNPLNNIVAVHNYELRDAEDQDPNDDKSILKINFKKLKEDLYSMFNKLIYFIVDSDLNLHIEHFKHFDKIRSNTPFDMRDPKFSYIKNYENWKYNNSKMYSLIEFETINAGYPDFKRSKITFDKLPSYKRESDQKISYSTQIISTDIQYCKENATDIDNGILLIAYDETNDGNVSRYGIGQKSGKSVLNGDLSISTLLERYGRYEGTWSEGFINDKPYAFENTKRCIEGKEITFKGILTNNNIINNIGNGLAQTKKINNMNRLTSVVFNYRYQEYKSSFSTGEEVVVLVLPTVDTGSSNTISNTSAICYGDAISDGGSEITEKGICYGTDINNITIAGDKVAVGTGIGEFNCTLDSLTFGIIYYYRAYAINSIGISYGAINSLYILEVSLMTLIFVNNYGTDFAEVGGEVISDGGNTVTERGVCYGTDPIELTISDIHEHSGSGIGEFNIVITGLTSNTRYFIRAYAINSVGTYYGLIMSFKTL